MDTETWPAEYFPIEQTGDHDFSLAVRTGTADPMSVVSSVTAAIRRVDAEAPVVDVQSMQQRIASSLAPQRSNMFLLTAFAGLALLLTALGIYSVISYSVRRRVREIGIRMALGAQRKQIGAQFLSLGLRLLAAGTILGLVGAWWAGRAMQSVLFDVPTLPIAILFGTAFVMTAVSLIACLIPAHRATKVDPIIALRYE